VLAGGKNGGAKCTEADLRLQWLSVSGLAGWREVKAVVKLKYAPPRQGGGRMATKTPNSGSPYVPGLLLLLSVLFASPAVADLVSAGAAYQKGDFDAAFKDYRVLAELGQPMAQFNVAVMYARGEGTRPSDIYAYAWASLAAENGLEKAKVLADSLRPSLSLAPGSAQIAADIEAQYGHAVLDQRLLPKIVTDESADSGERARCHPQRRAAQSGDADAEVTLAMYALRGDPDESRQKQAKLWLEQAAASGNHDGKLYLAALLAAAPANEARDPKRALTLLDDVFRGVKDDPAAFEIRAAAAASSGDFKDAVKSQSKAVSMAEHLKWDVAPLNERLAHYTASQPWYGTLLEF
jgi:TPR repeat protein